MRRCICTPWSSPPLRRSSAARCATPVCPGLRRSLTAPLAAQDIQDAFKGLPHFAEEGGDEPSVHKYNELATLMHVSGAFPL